jgi:hypothetical protein
MRTRTSLQNEDGPLGFEQLVVYFFVISPPRCELA